MCNAFCCCSVSKATFFPITPQNSVNISVNYVLHITKDIPVCEAIKKALHDVVYGAGKGGGVTWSWQMPFDLVPIGFPFMMWGCG